MHFLKNLLWIILLLKFPNRVESMTNTSGSNLTGSSAFAKLGQSFTWTCVILIPLIETQYGVLIKRNGEDVVTFGDINSECVITGTKPRYSYKCASEKEFTLTIPDNNMTEYEQGSSWMCLYVKNDNEYQSPSVRLDIAIDVYNVSLVPSDKPLTIRENNTEEVRCEVNSNAVPTPTITWYMGSTNITGLAGKDQVSINITGKRSDNGKTLECRARNTNIKPLIASVQLNVQYPPTMNKLTTQDVKIGNNLSVICHVTQGNPNYTKISWTKVGNTEFKQNKPTLNLPEIQKIDSGTYICAVLVIYSSEDEETFNQSMVVNVQYPPLVKNLSQQDIIEGYNLSVTCKATNGNPISTSFFWSKADNPLFKQQGATLELPNIQRNRSGIYTCTAENTFFDGEKGKHSQSMVVNVQYPPTVNISSKNNIIEGDNLTVTCHATPGNPNSSTIYWTMVNNTEFRQNRSSLLLPNINRSNSGVYRCTAENSYINGGKGTNSQIILINVLYQPTIKEKPLRIVNESQRVTISRIILSNPLSDVFWYYGTHLLRYQSKVTTATYTIENTTCTDTKNFTLFASNGIQMNATTSVDLIVNCKPTPDRSEITLGVTDTTGIEFSTTVIAYPEPWYKLEQVNGTTSDQMENSITRNAVNNFTFYFNQTIVEQSDYGIYHLRVGNSFGQTTVFVKVLAKRRPNEPDNITVTCEVSKAKVEWKSSFNGGDPQIFTVIALNDHFGPFYSDGVPDLGEDIIHHTYLQNLPSSVSYVFYVSAQNGRGTSLSENVTCTTLKKDSNDDMSIIAGGAAAGGIAFAVILIFAGFFLRRYMQINKQPGKLQRLDQQEDNCRDADVDGLKENILYVSAGPRDDEKPEVAVYAAVAKKIPQSDNNSNLYADVKKSGRHDTNKGAMSSEVKPKKGLFKKDEKAKHKKGKKPKNRPGEADVYENSEGIALSTNVDNVYSNAGQKGLNKQEERGYKNKDGLLYVEVNFDGKQGQDNPVIHGEDEKTDYATVEFPMPSALHKASGPEEL